MPRLCKSDCSTDLSDICVRTKWCLLGNRWGTESENEITFLLSRQDFPLISILYMFSRIYCNASFLVNVLKNMHILFCWVCSDLLSFREKEKKLRSEENKIFKSQFV